jgi:hypothetical protein
MVQKNYIKLLHIPSQFAKDKGIVLVAVKRNYQNLQHIDPMFKLDPDIALAALRSNGEALQLVDDSFRRDHDFILTAMANKGDSIKYADLSILGGDPTFMLKAIALWWQAIEYSHASLRTNTEFILNAVKFIPVK